MRLVEEFPAVCLKATRLKLSGLLTLGPQIMMRSCVIVMRPQRRRPWPPGARVFCRDVVKGEGFQAVFSRIKPRYLNESPGPRMPGLCGQLSAHFMRGCRRAPLVLHPTPIDSGSLCKILTRHEKSWPGSLTRGFLFEVGLQHLAEYLLDRVRGNSKLCKSGHVPRSDVIDLHEIDLIASHRRTREHL